MLPAATWITAVLMFSAALSLSVSLGVSLQPFVMVLMSAASCAFINPTGFQTNLMVQGPGGYTFGDFARVGSLLTLLVAITTTPSDATFSLDPLEPVHDRTE